ncbi:MAG TPA: DUF5671 domain-containing protein [Candidatus Limnocylindria bacterium]
MQAARRLYLYLLSGVSLGFVLFGLQSLVRVLLETFGMRGDVLSGQLDASQQLSGALALVGVGTPVWLLHWWFAERSIRPEHDPSDAERQSALRALYFGLVLAILMAISAFAISDLVFGLLADLFPTPDTYSGSPAGAALATAVVGGAAWGYHALLRRRDMAAGELRRAAVWLPRAYLYGAAFGGAVWSLTSLVPLVDAAVRSAVGDTVEPYVWIGSVGPTIVGAAIWAGHAWYASRLRADPGWRGASERAARLRLGYLVALIVVGVTGTIALASAALEPVLAALLGAGRPPDQIVPAMATGAIAALPFAFGGWWFHARSLRGESTVEVDPDRPGLAWRLEHVAVGLTGLAFAAAGSARLITITLDAALGAHPELSSPVSELALDLPLAILGGAVWIWAWVPMERRHQAFPQAEAASTVRRAGLLIVLAVAVIAGLSSLALILYRLFGFLLGAGLSGDAVGELSTPAGILVVALVAGLYHGLALRRDLAVAQPPQPQPGVAEREGAAAVPEPIPAEEAVWESEGGPVLPPGIPLTLRGPDGSDLEAALKAARDALPEGYRLERD